MAKPVSAATTSTSTGGLEAEIQLVRGDFEVDVSLQVTAGETAALLGPNGAGKSTIVASIAGLLPLGSGTIRLGGRVLDDPNAGVFVAPEHRLIGVVFQDQVLFSHLSALDNVAFGLTAQGMRTSEARERAQAWLEAVDLGDLSRRRPRMLSGGQRQRVALARALAPNPDLLLADEPLGSLDVTARNRLRRNLAAHLTSGRSGAAASMPSHSAEFSHSARPSHGAELSWGARDVPRLLITHDPTDAFVLADRVHILEGGRLTQSGTPDELRRAPATAYAADLSGINLVRGTARSGEIKVTTTDAKAGLTRSSARHLAAVVLHTADTSMLGSVVATIHPRAIALHRERPSGSPRNVWRTTADAVEPLGDITRVLLNAPLPLTADITPAAAHELGIRPGTALWVSVKATEVEVTPDGRE